MGSNYLTENIFGSSITSLLLLGEFILLFSSKKFKSFYNDDNPKILTCALITFFRVSFGLFEIYIGIKSNSPVLKMDGIHMCIDCIGLLTTILTTIKFKNINNDEKNTLVKRKFEIYQSSLLSMVFITLGFIGTIDFLQESLFGDFENPLKEDLGAQFGVAFAAITINFIEMTIYYTIISKSQTFFLLIIHSISDCFISILVIITVVVKIFNTHLPIVGHWSNIIAGFLVSMFFIIYGIININESFRYLIGKKLTKSKFFQFFNNELWILINDNNKNIYNNDQNPFEVANMFYSYEKDGVCYLTGHFIKKSENFMIETEINELKKKICEKEFTIDGKFYKFDTDSVYFESYIKKR